MPRSSKKTAELKTELKSKNLKQINDFLDTCIKEGNLKNDAALCRMLQVAPPVVSKMRHGVNFPGASFLIAAHENIGLSFERMRQILKVTPEYRF